MSTQRQKHLVLILAREFASNLSTPTLVADERGYLVYYNEAAEDVIGRRFAEVGEMPLDDWAGAFERRRSPGAAPAESAGRRGSRSTSAVRRTSGTSSRARTVSSARSR